MTTPQTPTPLGPELHQAGPQCPNCGAALAPDQRYCVNCGHRLTEPRVDFRKSLALEHPTPPPSSRPSIWDHRGTLITLASVLAVLVALGVGIVIGRGNGKPVTQANKPEILTVPTAAPATAPSSTATPASRDVGERQVAGGLIRMDRRAVIAKQHRAGLRCDRGRERGEIEGSDRRRRPQRCQPQRNSER